MLLAVIELIGEKMKKVWLKRNRRGEMGVGTMIIFIAMILIAAVAASVLIGTANKVRDQAGSTGDQAIQGVSAGLNIESATGYVAAMSDGLKVQSIHMTIKVVAGSPGVNIKNMLVYVTSNKPIFNDQTAGAATLTLYQSADMLTNTSVDAWNNTGSFGALNKASGDYAGWNGGYVITQGDTIDILIPLIASASTDIQVKMVPPYGSSSQINLRVPDLFTGEGYIVLR